MSAYPAGGSVPQAAGEAAASRAATKATAYGSSEVGAMLGGAVGPPIVGGIVGGIVGERLGEKGSTRFGITETAGQVSNDLAKVVGQKNVDKMGEITLTALGYSEEEECVCCPCLPASQSLLIIMCLFFGFNWYRIGVGIHYEWGCSNDGLNVSQVIEADNLEINDTLEDYTVVAEDPIRNTTTFLVAYPCEWGFHYLTSGAAVWLAFLPFYITQLLGNCWRQCCCCLCDPLVCFACCLDIIKRYLCECGSISFVSLIWHAMCAFQVVWALFAVDWWARLLYFSSDDYQHWDPQGDLWKTVLASICLDLLLAGSEIFHKIRLVHRKRSVAQEAAHGINSPPPTGYPSAAGPYYAPYPVQAQSVV